MRNADPAAHLSGAAPFREPGPALLRKLRPHSVRRRICTGDNSKRGVRFVMAKPVHLHGGAGLFGDPQTEAKPSAPPAERASNDGGTRGNPGPAAYGVVIRNPRGEIVARLKKYIGRTTNNVAEYYGLIAALDYAQANSIRALHIESDSELLVKQMRGQYRV